MDSGDRVVTEQRRRAAVLAGDEHACPEWYDTTSDHVRAYAHWACAGLHPLADEVGQETWLTAVRRVRAFDPARASFRSWIFGIAANVVRDHLRSADAERRRAVALAGAEPVAPGSSDVEA